MELRKGVCSLCSESKVFIPSDAEQFRTCLVEIVQDKYGNDENAVKDQITLCPLCCFKLQKASDIRKAIKEAEGKDSNEKHCRFCHSENHVMVVYSDWKFFNERLEGYHKENFPVYICQQCFFYFDTTFFAKSKLMSMFSQLQENVEKENGTPKRKSMLKSPALSKKRKMYDNCFTYLQPLSSSKEYQVANKLKKDRRLFKQIAYVDLENSQDVDLKETPKTRPVIKIKLKKPRGNVNEFVAEPYIKLVKSAEQVAKKANARNKVRHSSYTSREHYEIVNETSEKINETPKTGSLSQLAPKRRVSVFLDELEFVDEKSSNAELDFNKSDKVIDIASSDPSPTIDLGQGLINVAEISNDSNGVENGSCASNLDSEDVNNEAILNKNQEVEIDLNSASASPVSSHGSTPQKSGSEIGSDSDDKLMSEDFQNIDSLNGLERKKKRVTFSDEIN